MRSAMLASTFTAALVGVSAELVRVEADVSYGLPGFTIVGLPDASVRESRDRVRSAIRSSGLEFPPHRITVNLSPADLRKAGSSFDLPIALSVLAAGGQLQADVAARAVVLGELALDGRALPCRGVLPAALASRCNRSRKTGSCDSASGSSLSATVRPLTVSSAS